MLPSRVNVTIAVIATSGLAREGGGGFQHMRNRANASLMLSTRPGAACAVDQHDSISSAASRNGALRMRAMRPHLTSDATCTFTILSGSATGSPRLSLSTTSMPDTTSPITVYLPFSDDPSANMMKNCEFAELGSLVRAIPTIPRVYGTLENSAGKFGYIEPPVPLKFLPSPVCAMKPS